MNRILMSILGLAALAVSMSAAGQTADGGAKLSHLLPLLIDGGGYRTTLLVTNVGRSGQPVQPEFVGRPAWRKRFRNPPIRDLEWVERNDRAAEFRIPRIVFGAKPRVFRNP